MRNTHHMPTRWVIRLQWARARAILTMSIEFFCMEVADAPPGPIDVSCCCSGRKVLSDGMCMKSCSNPFPGFMRFELSYFRMQSMRCLKCPYCSGACNGRPSRRVIVALRCGSVSSERWNIDRDVSSCLLDHCKLRGSVFG